MHAGQDFVPLLIVTCASLISVLIALKIRVMRVPIVVGEIVLGMLIGRSGLGIIPAEPGPWLSFLSLFGFTMLMFLSGLEIDFHAVRRSLAVRGFSRGPLGTALVQFGFCMLLSLGFSFAMEWLGMIESPWIMALILSTTSVGIVVPLLKERGELNSEFGQALLLAAVVADFATMFLITILVAIWFKGGLTWDVAIIATLFFAFFAFVVMGRKVQARKGWMHVFREGCTATAQIRVRMALAVMLFFIVLSEFIGTEIILGAFLAGAVVSLLTQPGGGQLGTKLDAIGYGFLIPYFFIMVGAQFKMGDLLESRTALLLVPVLLLVACAVKLIPAWFLRHRFGQRRALAGGFLLSSRLSLIIAAAAIGLDMGAITSAVHSAIILVAVVTCLCAPLFYVVFMRENVTKKHQACRLEPLIGHLVHHPDGLNLMLGEVAISQKPSLYGHTLEESRLRWRTGVSVIAIVRGDKMLLENPPADVELKSDDILIVIGERQQIRALEELDRASDPS